MAFGFRVRFSSLVFRVRFSSCYCIKDCVWPLSGVRTLFEVFVLLETKKNVTLQLENNYGCPRVMILPNYSSSWAGCRTSLLSWRWTRWCAGPQISRPREQQTPENKTRMKVAKGTFINSRLLRLITTKGSGTRFSLHAQPVDKQNLRVMLTLEVVLSSVAKWAIR